uniref:UNC93-like protein MFSD11 n=1 Tax=Panagrolaimus sp. PS1159 TaxID=55785 RepID=A0AC35GKN3_9BILA
MLIRRRLTRFLRRTMLGFNPGTFNVLQLAIGFLCIFFAFNSQGFIEQTVVSSKEYDLYKHAGYISMAIIYGVFTLANFIAAPIVGVLGPKWAMVFGAACYAIFQCGFLFLNEYFLYISSAIIGVGAAVIWTAQGNYIAINSTEETASKNSSLFWAVSQVCLAGGGVFLYAIFANSKTNDDQCSPDAGDDDDDDISKSTVRILYSVFTAVTLGGALILALLRIPKEDRLISDENEREENERKLTQKELLVSTFKLLATKRMLFLSIAFMYTGIELSFWSSIYPSCISYTKALGTNTKKFIAFNAIAQGLGQFASGFLFGFLGDYTKKIGRISIVLLGSVIHLLVFVAVYINFPKESPLGKTCSKDVIIGHPSLAIAIICGFGLGFGDACWNTQIFSFLVSKYNKRSAEAFALFKFFQSLLTCAAFFYGTVLELQWHMLILVVTGVLGCFGFIVAERLPPDEREVTEYDNTLAGSSSMDQNGDIDGNRTDAPPPYQAISDKSA